LSPSNIIKATLSQFFKSQTISSTIPRLDLSIAKKLKNKNNKTKQKVGDPSYID
jgi:hypothetical protein